MNPKLYVETHVLIKKLDKAHKEIAAAAKRQWEGRPALNMSIPARPEQDSDLLISDALRSAREFIQNLTHWES